MKHTPGPWTVEYDPHSYMSSDAKILAGEDSDIIAYVDPAFGTANANLIAAAPDTLEALKLIRRYAESRDNEGLAGYAQGCALADKAIAKAEGRES